jgi:putative flippase GtrA
VKFIKNQIEKHPKLYEIFKFLLIGGFCTLVEYAVMALFLYVFKPPYAETIGSGVGHMIGFVFNYFLSILFVFTGKGNNLKKAKSPLGAFLFAFFTLIGIGIHILGMYLGYNLLHINEWVVKVVLTFIVLVFNYITRKVFIFKERK